MMFAQANMVELANRYCFSASTSDFASHFGPRHPVQPWDLGLTILPGALHDPRFPSVTYLSPILNFRSRDV